MERAEFAEAYERWYRPLLLYAYALARRWDLAEDLVQSAFTKALLSYRGEAISLRAWLIRVLRNEFLSLCRRDARLAEGGDLETPGGEDPLEQVLRQEEQRRVYGAVLALPERYREVLLQSVVTGLSDREMAALWNTTEENIRKIRSRAREKIRKQMEEGEA